MAAMAEIERDKPKPIVVEVPKEAQPWTPSEPLWSVY